MVALRGVNPWVLRDITSITDPKTISTFMTSPPEFVSGTELAYTDETGLFRMPLAGSPETLVATPGQGVSLFTWNPSGSTVAYLAQNGSGLALHLKTGSQDRAIPGSIPAIPVTGCESQFCGDNWDLRLSYSPDGAFISLVEEIAGVHAFRLWSSDGTLLISSDSAARSMSTWSGHNFYFPGAKGVEMWRDGVTTSFLPGVTWIRPLASPAGGAIVFATKDSNGWSHTFVVDTTTRKVRELKTARFHPAFLTSRYIWYQGQRACVASDSCPSGWTVVDNGKTYIYDLQDSTETESVITAVFDVWPHAA
jgi:dipeptidyl aminopeptidase/acylaminoacyl peptidase